MQTTLITRDRPLRLSDERFIDEITYHEDGDLSYLCIRGFTTDDKQLLLKLHITPDCIALSKGNWEYKDGRWWMMADEFQSGEPF